MKKSQIKRLEEEYRILKEILNLLVLLRGRLQTKELIILLDEINRQLKDKIIRKVLKSNSLK